MKQFRQWEERGCILDCKKYRSDLQEFITYICQFDSMVKDDYKEAWKYIEKELNFGNIIQILAYVWNLV